MILQETEIDMTIGFTIVAIIFIVLIVIIGITIIYFHISLKIHESYHKGYNKAKDDKVQYYATIKEIIDDYDKIFLDLTKEGSNYVYKASTLGLMLSFRKSLKDYYNN